MTLSVRMHVSIRLQRPGSSLREWVVARGITDGNCPSIDFPYRSHTGRREAITGILRSVYQDKRLRTRMAYIHPGNVPDGTVPAGWTAPCHFIGTGIPLHHVRPVLERGADCLRSGGVFLVRVLSGVRRSRCRDRRQRPPGRHREDFHPIY